MNSRGFERPGNGGSGGRGPGGRTAAAACLLAAILPMGCHYGVVPIRDVERSPRLTPFSFIEEGRLLVLIVGVEAARFRQEEEFLPLAVAVGNRRVRPALQITRESFYLVDDQNERWEMASYAELLERYPYREMDRRLLGDRGFIRTKFDAYRRMHVNFFPFTGGGGVRQERTELPVLTYLEDLLYFPRPPGPLKGRRFDLFVDGPPLEDPVFVTFEIR